MDPGKLPFLVAFDQCGLELQGPHMVTTTKRLIPGVEVDATMLGRDGLRYHAWDPEAVRASYSDLDPAACYEIEAVFACERGVARTMALEAGGIELVPAIALSPGAATTVRASIPAAAIRDGRLDIALKRRRGPDALVSELRLYGSAPVAPTITIVGDSRGGMIGTVSDATFAGLAAVEVTIGCDGSEVRATTDDRGMFRIAPSDMPSPARPATLSARATVGGQTATVELGTRELARGLREMPGAAERLSLAGEWQFLPGRASDPEAPEWAHAAAAHVPGHVAFEGLIPDRGVATLRRQIDVPDAWTDDCVLARFDGAYGRAEVFVNGQWVGTHGAGATSFDVDLTPSLKPRDNVLTIVLTEYTPHAVIDYMSWYAHTSLLGLWREALLFHVPQVHIDTLDLRVDWEQQTGSGTIEIAAAIVNADDEDRVYSLELSVSDAGRLLHRTTLSGEVIASGGVQRRAALVVPDVAPWSAEMPRLYDLEMVLVAAGRATAYRRRIGFRRVEVCGNRLLVNGAPIRLLGVNRHDARMKTGRSMRYEDLRHDVLALRQANVNIIRTAHYPADPRLLELCDELGMYVQDQMPICFAAGFDDHHWTRSNEAAPLVPYVLEVTAETVGRDQGHASVIIWDLANETQWAWGFDAQLALVRAMDPSRPTLFSFDLNQLGDANPLPHMPPANRPDIRTYHYPGWDRSWQEDIDWLRTLDQPVVLDECNPPFQDNARAPLHAELLAIDPGLRDYWVVGATPFMAKAMRDSGCIGGMIWSAVDDQWVLPLDESIGSGSWSHLTKLDYYRVRDVHPPQDGLVFRGEGEWGLLDGWGRPRPELWHVHKLYSPIEIAAARFEPDGRLALTLVNRHAHRPLETLDVRIAGARRAGGARGARHIVAAAGESVELVLEVAADAKDVELSFHHPEGWMVDAFSWTVPGREPDLRAAARAVAEPVQATGRAALVGPWLTSWPRFHAQDANRPFERSRLPAVDVARARVTSDGATTAPLVGEGWDGSLSLRTSGPEVVFEYACRYVGDEDWNAREIGLAFELPAALSDLWWHRRADWSVYPDGHIGRPRGYARSAPAPANPLRPAARWEDDTSDAGSNDYRSTKRAILAAGATDGRMSVTVLSDGSQHVRAAIVDGAPVLHVLDWYGGVPFRLDTDHIWTATFGTGKRICRGTMLQGRIALVYGRLPEGIGAREAPARRVEEPA